MASEAGHEPNRVYFGRDGAFYMNGAPFYNSDGNDIKAQLDVLDTTVAAELAFIDGALAGTVVADKAAVVDSNKDIGDFRNLDVTNLDAGLSGTAGTVDVFPSTSAKGKLAISCADQSGDTTVALVAGAMAAARTITIPDPLADADVLLGKQAAVARTTTTDGTTTGTIADGGMLQFIAVTSDSADKIIILPTPTPGTIVVLYVGANGYELRTDTPASVAINGGSGSNAESAIAADMMVVAICTSATTWHGFTVTAATLAAIAAAAA